MTKIYQPLPWELYPQNTYVPISFEQRVIGLCKPNFAARIVEALNDDEKVRKALYMACNELSAQLDGTITADELMQQYLLKAQRPTHGAAFIALLLQERQESLDLTDEEFAKFCDTFRLSREELRNIFAGEEIESTQLGPLCRILGLTMDELIEAWKGSNPVNRAVS